MRPPDLILYLGSRIASAVGNLASVVLFARVLGPAEYGAYILISAWAVIVYGFAAQWMKFAYFGVYRAAAASAYISAYAWLVIASLVVAALGLSAVAPIVGWTTSFIGALAALLAATALYEAAVEVSRTRLQSGTVAFAMVCRAVFVLAGGLVALRIWPSAAALALAVAAGHVAAAVPCFVSLRGFAPGWPDRATVASLIRYGWPLIFSFGVFALGQTVDRLLIAWYAGNAVLGPYGVIADLMRQSFMVVGEAITLALITVAKQHANEGRHEASDQIMRQAYVACIALATLGAGFFIVFGRPLAALALGGDFTGAAYDIVTPFALAFAFMTMRNFYFGQVIYFTDATLLELVTAIVFVSISLLLGVLLVPFEGAFGGAVALLFAHATACAVVVVRGRRLYRFPVELGPLVGAMIAAIAFVTSSRTIERLVTAPTVFLVQGAIFALVAIVLVWRFGLFGTIGVRGERGKDAP